MLDALINAGAKLAGGFMDRSAAKDANATRIALANQEYERQKEFAQMGISWKVKDALSAGVHPLFALGASTSSYAPQSIGVEKTSLGSALGEMGQDVSRAVASGSTNTTKAAIVARDAIALDGLKLDNDIKRATLAKALKELQPPAAGIAVPEAGKFEDRPKLSMPAGVHSTNPNTTNAEDFEKRYGEMSDFVHGPQIWMRDELDSAGGYELTKAARALLKKLGIL